MELPALGVGEFQVSLFGIQGVVKNFRLSV